MDNETIQEWQGVIIENSLIVEDYEKLDIIKEDPDDNKFLEAAIAGNADFIISQDNHLLKLKEFNNVKIIIPEEFLKIINN